MLTLLTVKMIFAIDTVMKSAAANVNNMTNTSGTITFEQGYSNTGLSRTFIEHISGKTVTGDWAGSVAPIVGDPFELCVGNTCTDLKFITVSPNHIELTDSHGDTIRLMR
jgi:hypothetical protein